MVTTRSQSSQNRQVETENMDRSSDNESESSFSDLSSRDQIVDLDSDDVLTRCQNSNNYSIDQRFNEINRQIGDLTNIVLTLTNQFASVNGEGNILNTATTSANSRSDRVSCLFHVYNHSLVQICSEDFPRSQHSVNKRFNSSSTSLELLDTSSATGTVFAICSSQISKYIGILSSGDR